MEESLVDQQIGIIEYCYMNIDNFNLIEKEDRDEIISIATGLLELVKDNKLMIKIITLLYEACFCNDMRLEEIWELYWLITSFCFRNSNVSIKDGSTRLLYNAIFDHVTNVLPKKYDYQLIGERNKDVVVIVTSQLLGISHAPTIRIFDYAYTLQHELHKSVVIINDSGTNYIHNPNIHNYRTFNYINDYNDINSINYKDESFYFIQNPDIMPNLSSIQKFVNVIYNLNPLLVFNVGGSSLVADYCSFFTTTLSLPCSYKIPISCSKYLLVGRRLNADDKDVINCILDYQKIIELEINYQYRQNNLIYSRKQFGISEDRFLIAIVGNRLCVEVSNEFLIELRDVITILDNVDIVFIGEIINKDMIKKILSYDNRVFFTDVLNEAGEFLRHCDLYINPKRNGGGRSSFEALHFGVPVVTPKYGDVYYTCGEEFSYNEGDKLVELVEQYVTCPDYLLSKKELARDRAKHLANIKANMEIILETAENDI